MHLFKFIVYILTVCGAISSAWASSLPLEQQKQEWLQNWAALPERPDLISRCTIYKSWAIGIFGMKTNGYTIEVVTNWAEQRSAKETVGLDPLTAQAVETDMLHIVGTAYYGDYLYKMVPGGFVEYIYHNCLKDQPF
jgi:hypothetical protein